MAERLILDTLEALGHEDRDAFRRGLDRLAPLATYLIAARGLDRDEIRLDCGPVSLRIRFLYGETDSGKDDVGVPFVVAEPGPGEMPTLAIATTSPADDFLGFADRAEGECPLRVVLRRAEESRDRDDDEGGEGNDPGEETNTTRDHEEEQP